MGQEPHVNVGVHLYKEAEPGIHHGPRATWHRESPPLRRGGAGVLPWAQSHVAARESGRLSHGALCSMDMSLSLWIHPGYISHMNTYRICGGYVSSKYPKKFK
jgi:hypothetical protein